MICIIIIECHIFCTILLIGITKLVLKFAKIIKLIEVVNKKYQWNESCFRTLYYFISVVSNCGRGQSHYLSKLAL